VAINPVKIDAIKTIGSERTPIIISCSATDENFGLPSKPITRNDIISPNSEIPSTMNLPIENAIESKAELLCAIILYSDIASLEKSASVGNSFSLISFIYRPLRIANDSRLFFSLRLRRLKFFRKLLFYIRILRRRRCRQSLSALFYSPA